MIFEENHDNEFKYFIEYQVYFQCILSALSQLLVSCSYQ